MKKCFIVFLSLIIICGCKDKKAKEEVKDSVNSNSNTEEKINNIKTELTMNVGDKAPTIEDYNLEKNKLDDEIITWNNLVIQDDKVLNVGEYTGTIKYDGKDIFLKLIVLDNVSPTIDNVKDITIVEGNTIDLKKQFKISDNSNDELNIEIIGNYNFNKVGTYNLKIKVTDKGNNTKEESFKLIVKEKAVVSNVTSNTVNNSTNSTSDKTGITSKGYKVERKNGLYYINGILIANKTYDLPSTYNPGGLTNEFMTAYNKMKNAAQSEGLSLKIISGFRSYQTQQTLYNRYVNRDGKAAADTYSARAGHSEHQTGLAADLNEISDTFGDTKTGKWLSNNCWKYGFILRYPKGKQSITGYIYESWHFRYIGDVELAKTLYNNNNWLTLEEYFGIDSKY